MNKIGTIILIRPTEYKGAKNFAVREMIISTEEQYPQKLKIQFYQDNCGLLDQVSIGDKVNVFINLKGNEYTNKDGETKYFNSFEGWKIQK